MASMDVFKTSAFTMTSLTGTVEKMDYKPMTLGELNLFEPQPVRTREVWIERRDYTLSLIPTSPIAGPPEELNKDKRDAIPFKTTRLAKAFTLYAEEVQGIRAFGSETEMMQVQTEYLRHLGRIRDDMELTHEYHRLGALQGMLLDSDGTSVIYDYFSELNVSVPAEIDFALDTSSTNVRQKCKDLVRAMARSARGAFTPGTTIHALCGDSFYDKFTNHGNVEKYFLSWQGADALRASTGAFGTFFFEGVYWHNYRGTDDESTVAIGSTKAKFFPVGARDVFKVGYAPAEFGPYVNTLGSTTPYAINILDRDREAWTRGELYHYPLYICQRPDILRTGKEA